jgi:hypothetical protein
LLRQVMVAHLIPTPYFFIAWQHLRYLVVGLIAIFDTEVVIFNIDIKIGENEFFFNEFPDDACHFIAIEFYNRVCYLDFIAC